MPRYRYANLNWMKAGVVVEVEIDKVGCLRNAIADETPEVL
ncbi:2-keto-4-pentenoate hydratase/2-oxohepta-3-ene-1,7-dioic acid hydratase in catechol pathway [Bradyrhizobium sp. USDA 326]